MSRIAYYVDEHVPRAVVRGLRARGVDALTVIEAGLAGATDEIHLQRAREENRVLVTCDADFLRLHASGAEHAGIVYAPQETSVGQMVQALLLVHHVLESEEMFGRLEFVRNLVGAV